MSVASIIPQVVTAIATLAGVVITLAASSLRDKRTLNMQDAWKEQDRIDTQVRWIRAERRSAYAKFLLGLEEITRTIKQNAGEQASEGSSPAGLVEARAVSGTAWDALIELRLVGPDSVVEIAQETMYHFRARCEQLEVQGDNLEGMRLLLDRLLELRIESVRAGCAVIYL